MKISLYLPDKVVEFRLPYTISGSFSFDVNEEDDAKLINVEARNGKWFLYSTEDVKIIGDTIATDGVVLATNNFYILERNKTKYLIYISKLELGNFLVYSYDSNLSLTIGSTPNNTIQYNCEYTNDLSINITHDNNQLLLSKTGTSTTYINKSVKDTNPVRLKSGDEIEIYGLKLIIINNLILLNKNSNIVINNIESSGLKKWIFPIQERPEDIEIKDQNLYMPDDYFSKSPRMRRLIETKELSLSPPPKEGDSQELPILLVVGPMLTMAVTSGTMIINVLSKMYSNEISINNSWPQLVTGGAMLISTILWPLITQKYNKKLKKQQKQEIINKYTKYLAEKKTELEQESKLQRTILTENLIPVQDCLNIINNRGLNFWDKRLDQNDFLVVRVGIGNQLLNAKVEYPKEGFTIEESELRKKADSLVEEFKYIDMVPVSYSFYENKTTAIMGQDNKITDFVNNLIVQLVTFYSYEDLKTIMFTNEKNQNNWEYLKYLNHSFSNDKSIRFFSSTKEDSKIISEFINYEIGNRLSQSTNNTKSIIKPYYLIITDDYDMIKRYDFVKTITEFDENIGFSLVIIENKLSKLPSKCNNFITLGDKKSGILKNAYENQQQINFTNEIYPDIDMMMISKTLSNIPIELESGINRLPNSINFLEMEKIGKVEQLNILNRWNTNDSTSSLKAEVGVDEQGNLMYLDLHEKFHGPHGLIAGMTGSGKSEFIITYILSMAINYSPDDVSFILIDYKGGGLAGAFENKTTGMILPHLAGVITNLDKAEMDRTLVSIDSEIKRRQQIFNNARDSLGESTIDIYKYQRFYKDGRLSEPIPHLFIICDEFAELKSQQPEFMDNLISVARIGRSLGVHLILATQKPSGVVNDQIWSNTKFRVCLKVQDESDSKEMLKRSEAASLKQTGRFYLQVGYDEYFALGQSAWCGAKYYPSDKIIKQTNKSVDFINNTGQFIKSIAASNGVKVPAQGEQLSAILKNVIEVSQLSNKQSRKLWLDNIPPIILAENIELKYNVKHEPYKVEAIIGEYDAPEKQEQGLVKYNYLEDGNTIIYGNDGSEIELLLNTIIYSTIKNHTSNEVNYYIIDYGSESLRRYINIPHVGGIVFASEEEKYSNLFKLLKEELNYRKKLFIDYGGEYSNYIKNNQSKLPLDIVIINNYDSLYDSNPDVYDILPELIRDSERYGLVFILTANSVNSIYSKISQNCKNVYAYKLKDQSDYNSIFGLRAKIMPRDIKGRGLIKNDGIHEFQTASIVENDNDLSNLIKQVINAQSMIQQKHAKKIPMLPKIVRVGDVSNKPFSLNSIPIGIEKKDLSVNYWNFLNNIGTIISSTKLNNTKNFVISLIQEFKILSNTILILFDPMQELSTLSSGLPNYYTEKLDEILPIINKYIQSLIDNNSTTQGIIVIYGLNKFVSKISDTNKLVELTKLLKEYEKIGIAVVDDSSKIKNYGFESWFTSIFSLTDGIWIGKGLSEQNLIRISTITREMTQEYKNDMGYVISEGSTTLCKYIDFVNKEEE